MSNETRSQQLLDDILANVDAKSLRDFLEIQCGFSENEATSWIKGAQKECNLCGIDDEGFFQEDIDDSLPADWTEPDIPRERIRPIG